MSKEGDLRVTFGRSIQDNQLTLQKINDLTSLLFGTIAGILQLESQYGFITFIIGYLMVNIVVIQLLGGYIKLNNYFQSLWGDIVFGNLGRSMSSYLMMWCLVYALIDT